MDNKVEILTPLQSYQFVESFYDLSTASHFWFKWRFEAFLQQLKDLNIPLKSGWKVFDVGAGVAVTRQQIEGATDWTVDVTDMDYQALTHSEAGRGKTFYYDITEKLPGFKEKYDAIILFDVLEHIEDTAPFIEALLFHIKKGGYLFVNVPALQTLFSRYDEVQGHYRRYNTSNLPEEFKNFPFEMKDVRYWGMANVPLLFVRKYMLALTAKNKSKEEVLHQGFAPPSPMVNNIFTTVSKSEMTLMKKPFSGSSVLWAGQKV